MIQIDNQFFLEVKVEDQRIPLNPSQLRKVKVTESIDNLLPTFEFKYDEIIPLFHEHIPLNGMDNIEFEVASSVKGENLVTKRFNVLKAEPTGTEKRSSDAPAVHVRGVMDGVQTIKTGHRRSLNGLPSEVVQTIVNPVTTNTSVEQCSDELNGSWIQPGWTNGQMINYLKSSAYSTDTIGTYRSFFRFQRTSDSRDNRQFVFRTLNSLYEQPRPQDPYGKLVYNPQLTEQDGANQDDNLDNKAQNLIVGFDWVNDARRPIKNGALGHRQFAYDWNNGEWLDEYKTIRTETSHNHLARKLHYSLDDEADNYNFQESYSGRVNGSLNENVESDANEQVINAHTDVSELQVRVKGYLPRIFAGTKVRVVVTDSSLRGNKQQVISGDWLVREKSEIIKGTVWTALNLVRTGLNEPRSKKQRFPDAKNVVQSG